MSDLLLLLDTLWVVSFVLSMGGLFLFVLIVAEKVWEDTRRDDD